MSNPVSITVESGRFYLTQEAWEGHPDPYEDAVIELTKDEAVGLIVKLIALVEEDH